MMKRLLSEEINVITPAEMLSLGNKISWRRHEEYYSMYSSIWHAIIVDPSFMMIPIDDHMVHRGDGVFEAFKCINGNLYNVHNHLRRLEYSARAIGITLPFDIEDILTIVKKTIRVSGHTECLIRLFVSRGPGSFTANPYECSKSQLYVIVTSLSRPPKIKYEKGVTMNVTKIPIKPSFFANIKSCNYLPNVLMKKESVDSGVDFVVSLDEKGFLCESSTENVGILNSEQILLFPTFGRILRGTTVTRASELAEALVLDKKIKGIHFVDITLDMAYKSQEIMTFGTTFDILPVVSFNGHQVGSGKPGSVFKSLYELLQTDMISNSNMLTAISF